jgi:triosephosphate isomerase
MIIINFKNYKIGKEVLDLVRTIDINCNNASIAVPSVYLKEIAKETTMPVYCQSIDSAEKGRGTGKVIPEMVLEAGAKGSLLNHSENKIKFSEIKKIVERCREIGLNLIVCAGTLKEAEKIKKLSPYAIAFEDPKLIASGKSIVSHKTNSVKKFVEMLKDTDILPLCGAGISTPGDVASALLLGCKGVLVSSAIANSQSPEKFLKEIAQMF